MQSLYEQMHKRGVERGQLRPGEQLCTGEDVWRFNGPGAKDPA